MADQEQSIGALWRNEKDGKEYFSGNIEVNGEKLKVIVFKNTYKNKENSPDYLIYNSRPKPVEEKIGDLEPF